MEHNDTAPNSTTGRGSPTTAPTERSLAALIFAALFAAQAALVTPSPILDVMAADLSVDTAVAGQLRTVSGGIAGLVAMGVLVARRGRNTMRAMRTGAWSVMAGAAFSAVSPTFQTLALAQIPLGVGLALLVTAGTAAAGSWRSDRSRVRLLSWALAGQPTAWVIGLPLIGWLGDRHWRLAWLVPVTAGAVAGWLATGRRTEEDEGRVSFRALRGWATGELLAYAGWSASLVYAGAVFTGPHGVSNASTGVILGLCAIAYLPGNFLARRVVGRNPRRVAVALLPLMAVTAAVFGALHPNLRFSVTAFASLCFLGGARTLAGGEMGLRLARHAPLDVMSVRTALVQFGYFFGSALGGVGLSLGSWPGFGLAVGLLLAVAAVPYARLSGPSEDRHVHADSPI